VILDILIYLSAHKDRIPLVFYASYFTSVEVWSYIVQVCERFPKQNRWRIRSFGIRCCVYGFTVPDIS